MEQHNVSNIGIGGNMVMQSDVGHRFQVRHIYDVEHWRDGKLIWSGRNENLVTTAGLNYYLDAALKTGVASPVLSVGLKGTGAVAAGDIMGALGNWTDQVPYSNGTRPPWTPGAISSGSVDNSASKAVFNINATGTIWGAFLVGVSGWGTIKSGTIGTLLGAGDFTSSRIVLSGDTLNVTVTCTQTAS